ncbi:GpE family phage tail protein [Pectobacterium parmentieri]|nr:GpE family phage tail protein [Pectobacterium parmentieri]
MGWIWLTIWRYKNDFSTLQGWLHHPKTLIQAQALLARWFRFQPSELNELDLDEFESWLETASEQIKRENGDSD